MTLWIFDCIRYLFWHIPNACETGHSDVGQNNNTDSRSGSSLVRILTHLILVTAHIDMYILTKLHVYLLQYVSLRRCVKHQRKLSTIVSSMSWQLLISMAQPEPDAGMAQLPAQSGRWCPRLLYRGRLVVKMVAAQSPRTVRPRAGRATVKRASTSPWAARTSSRLHAFHQGLLCHLAVTSVLKRSSGQAFQEP